ncbi:hypothetical protein IJO12_00250 [bacterium]|nr:hypothetical protein [bacterium]
MEKKEVAVLAIQIGSIVDDFNHNLIKAERLITYNLDKHKADILILPEVWTCGWECSVFKSNAESLDNSRAIKFLGNIAKKYCVNVIGGSVILDKGAGICVNASPVFSREGKLVAIYEKNHLFSYYGSDENKFITPGKNPVMVELDGVKIGLTICYDIRFPEIYRAYRMAGADIMVNMAAWGASKKIPWDVMTASRAVENQCYFVALTQSGNLKDGTQNLGHSMIIDYKGEILSEITSGDGGIFAVIKLDEMYEFREKCTILDDVKKNYEVILK